MAALSYAGHGERDGTGSSRHGSKSRYIQHNPHVKAHSEFDALIMLIEFLVVMRRFRERWENQAWLHGGDGSIAAGLLPLLLPLKLMPDGVALWVTDVNFWLPRGFSSFCLSGCGQHFHLITGPMNVFFNGNARIVRVPRSGR